MSSKLVLCVLALISLTPLTTSQFSSNEEFTTEFPALLPTPVVTPDGFVNCEHIHKQLMMDSSLFYIGTVLDKCLHHGVTVDEIESGLNSVSEREDIGIFEYVDLYLPCKDVFSNNTSKMTTRLVNDYLECQSNKALDFEVMGHIERRFADIIEVYTIGNQSLTIDDSTMVSCNNASKRIALLCRDYGITEEQWKKGFLRYHYLDKWVVEEDLADLSITCDQIFTRRLEEQVYEDSLEAFAKCLNTMGLSQDTRDSFEKRNGAKLKQTRELDAPGLDLRNFVSCRYLQPIKLRNGLVSVSWHAYEKCKTIGVTYDELQAGIEVRRDEDDESKRDLNELYVSCETVFNDELYSFNTALAKDYEACSEADKISPKTSKIIQKKFEKMFKLFAMKRARLSRNGDITSHLVRCSNFSNTKLIELCRRRGTTMAQELRGIGSLARLLGDRWLNTDPLENLYVRCDDLFDDYKKYMREIPIEQYMHCRWIDDISEDGKKFIDKRIGRLYKNKKKENTTRYRGDSDVEISSVILFDQDGRSDVAITLT